MPLETPTLNTGDLTLRATSVDDTESFAVVLTENYDRLSEWMDLPPLIPDEGEHRDAMQKELERRTKRNEHWWLIWEGKELAGSISLLTPEGRANWGLIGYWLAESHTGRGLASRAVRRLIDWAFKELELNRVEIQTSINNRKSCAVPERIGIRRESIRRQGNVIGGLPHDMASYVAFTDDWPPAEPDPPLPLRTISVDVEITLRPTVLSDQKSMWQAINDGREYLAEYLPWMTEYDTEENYHKRFSQRRLEKDPFGRSGEYTIEYGGELAGTVGFGLPNRDNGVEIGYWLRQDLQGRGIMTRSVTAIIDMIFDHMKLHRVMIRAATPNKPSRGIPERLGFKHEGALREAAFVQGRYLDLEVYSLLEHEWRERRR
jgi:ribosomal-protein-serine acetyltransferase